MGKIGKIGRIRKKSKKSKISFENSKETITECKKDFIKVDEHNTNG